MSLFKANILWAWVSTTREPLITHGDLILGNGGGLLVCLQSMVSLEFLLAASTSVRPYLSVYPHERLANQNVFYESGSTARRWGSGRRNRTMFVS